MASALQAAQAAVWTLFHTAWTLAEPDVPIAWPNVQFTPPDPPAPWIAPALTWGDGFPQSIGPAGTNQVIGVLGVRINAPRDEGGARLMELGDRVRTIVNRVTSTYAGSGVRFDVPSGPRRMGTTSGWDEALVTVGLSAEESLA